MKSPLRLLVVVPLAFVLGACGAAAQGPRQLTQADAGASVDLHAGERLEIVLNGNPTTGYQWEVASVNETVLKSLGQPAYKSDSTALGSGGTYTFAFQAVAAGQTALQLVYHRSFEKNVAPLQAFQITAVVR